MQTQTTPLFRWANSAIAVIAGAWTLFHLYWDLSKHTSDDAYPEPAIARFFLATSGATALWFVVRMNVGAQWFLAGWEKVQDPTWGASGTALTGFVNGALAKASGAHPS